MTTLEQKALREHCELFFGFKILSWEPIQRGWLNLKWKIVTNQGVFVIKQYHSNRFKNTEILNRSLQQQKRLNRFGLPCPNLLSNSSGEFLHTFPEGIYIVMEFCKGEIMQRNNFSTEQLFDLGSIIGKMHRILNDGTIRSVQSPQFVIPHREERIEYWSKKAQSTKDTRLLEAIELQRKVTEKVNINEFLSSKQAWVHRDLWVDNLLFNENQVSAILDFDRLNFDYLELDVARVILSCTFYNNNFNTELASSFLNGYRTEYPFEVGSLVHSLKLLWYLESEWWINKDMHGNNTIPARFAEEMIWLAKNYENLYSITGHQ